MQHSADLELTYLIKDRIQAPLVIANQPILDVLVSGNFCELAIRRYFTNR
jgi:hypothetical protein